MARKKKNTSAKYAFIGLIIALLACISTGLVAAAKGMIAIGMFTVPNTNVLTIALEVSAGLIVVGLAVYAILDPDTVRRFFTGRQVRYGSNSLILSLAVIGIVIVGNVLAFQNPKSWDMTEDKSNTLAPETMQALATLPEKVTATGFFSANLSTSTADSTLLKFKTNSRGKFDYKFVNPDTDPVAARQAGITGDGKVLLTMGDRKEVAASASESDLTQALIRLINPTPRTVYFLQGHGEPSLTSSSSNTSYSVAKSTLESKNYTVNTLNLLTTNKIPADALAIIIAGPQKPLASSEVTLLKQYVDKGGSLVVMEDPTVSTEFGTSPDPLANYLTSDWGIKLDNDIVIDLVNTQNPLQAISSQASTTHPITKNLTQNYVVILPQARSLSITGQITDVTQTPILLTSQNSWGETDFNSFGSGQTPSFDPASDVAGPLNLAVAAENSKTKGRVVVFGNSLFATDNIFDAYGNGNIFINSVDWAAQQDNLINITPRTPKTRTYVPPTQVKFLIMVITAVFVLPGLVVFAGVSSWVSRRKRG